MGRLTLSASVERRWPASDGIEQKCSAVLRPAESVMQNSMDQSCMHATSSLMAIASSINASFPCQQVHMQNVTRVCTFLPSMCSTAVSFKFVQLVTGRTSKLFFFLQVLYIYAAAYRLQIDYWCVE